MTGGRTAAVLVVLAAAVAAPLGARGDETGAAKAAEDPTPRWQFYTNRRLYGTADGRASPSPTHASRPAVRRLPPASATPRAAPSHPLSPRESAAPAVVPRSAADSGVRVPVAPLPGSAHRSRGALPRGSLSGRGGGGRRGR